MGDLDGVVEGHGAAFRERSLECGSTERIAGCREPGVDREAEGIGASTQWVSLAMFPRRAGATSSALPVALRGRECCKELQSVD